MRLVPAILVLSLLLASVPAAAAPDTELDLLTLLYADSELVESATRAVKPASQAAENITLLTSREIEELNVHSLAHLLSHVTGVMIDFQGEGYAGLSIPHLQGSDEWHVLVLLDGIPWNLPSGGVADLSTIPVAIVDRVEIVRGPASSAWGSSLGGVVNVITKTGGGNTRGAVGLQAGEYHSWDGRAEVAGAAGPVGYYLHAGRIESDGLGDGRYIEANSFYGKADLSLSRDARLTLTAGGSDPSYKFGDYTDNDLSSTGSGRTVFGTLSLDSQLNKAFSFRASVYGMSQENVQTNDVLGVGLYGASGDLFMKNTFSRDALGGSARLIWSGNAQSVVLGLDAAHNEEEVLAEQGLLLQAYGIPAERRVRPEHDTWAVYVNDTILLGPWAITPGLRYDSSSIGEDFISPSLGLTWSPTRNTVLRASVARGFTNPPTGWTSIGGLLLDPNPDLKPEVVWSYQAGVETRALPGLRLKLTLFRHDQDDTAVNDPGGGGPPAYNSITVNDGHVHRTGGEFEVETSPLYGLSLRAGFDYVRKEVEFDDTELDLYGSTILLRYDGGGALRAALTGRYRWWDQPPSANASYDDFIWDLVLRHRLFIARGVTAEASFALHNLFNGTSCTRGDTPNARRWAEGGLRLSF